ncbi:MAG: hypothetical protein FJY85_25055, partial [Deltaproteobacteria bacterium]|nr:hypothetical protein [Deltaproteobacteria bacterium]
MKKQLVLTLCIVGLILGSATLADAGKFTWTVLTHSDAATKGPGADWLVGSGSDPTDNCNFNPVKTCSSGTAPTIGSYSYTWLDGPQTKSCALGTNQGKTCDTNADCGGIT